MLILKKKEKKRKRKGKGKLTLKLLLKGSSSALWWECQPHATCSGKVWRTPSPSLLPSPPSPSSPARSAEPPRTPASSPRGSPRPRRLPRMGSRSRSRWHSRPPTAAWRTSRKRSSTSSGCPRGGGWARRARPPRGTERTGELRRPPASAPPPPSPSEAKKPKTSRRHSQESDHLPCPSGSCAPLPPPLLLLLPQPTPTFGPLAAVQNETRPTTAETESISLLWDKGGGWWHVILGCHFLPFTHRPKQKLQQYKSLYPIKNFNFLPY